MVSEWWMCEAQRPVPRRASGIFVIPLWQYLLANIREKNISRQCRDLNLHYQYKMVMDMEKAGILELKKVGRETIPVLTEEGKRLQEHCREVYHAALRFLESLPKDSGL